MEEAVAVRGMRTFLVVWVGQLISVLGSGLTGFALGVWVYLETGSVTLLALIVTAAAVPGIVLAPIAGTLVDRFDRRTVMILADTAAGAATMALAVLFMTDSLELWHIYFTAAVGSTANAFQEPAYTASITLLVPKKHLGRASGMVQTAQGIATVVTPVVAGILVATVGLGGVLIVDVVTFLVAVTTLAVVRIPRPPRSAEATRESVWKETAAGWTYLRVRTGLLMFLMLAAILNFLLGFMNVLYLPLFLSFTNEAVLGTALSISGLGMLAGSVAASAWGGPQTKRMRFILSTVAVAGALIAIAGLRPSTIWITSFAFGFLLLVPLINATSQALWQTKVAPDYQGRVFALRRMLAQIAAPVAFLLAGPLADRVFEPLMAADGALAGTLGQVMGVGPGRGVGLMFVIMGLGAVLTGIFGYMLPRVRNVETELPDVIPDTAEAVAAA